MTRIRRLSSSVPGFDVELARLTALEAAQDDAVDAVVAAILADVRSRGDAAVLDYTRRFDRLDAPSVASLEIDRGALEAERGKLPGEQRAALETAAERVRRYHERQRGESWSYRDADGTLLGQKVTPIDRAGLYVPGGKAAYPSSVLMNALPAKVAGVGELIMVVPTPDGERNGLVLAAAAVAGVDRVFAIGGAQAVGALAYGTQTVPAVDKVVGPGNRYVAAAKRRVFGVVGIDMVAGPSEILVICDGGTHPDWIAMDLFSQAEHDEVAQAILVSPDAAFLDRVAAAIEQLLPHMPRRDVIAASLADRGALIHVRDLDEACEIANRIAPEHLELSVADPEACAARIRHAGAMFLGRYSSEALGDYCAGPNHVLPTSRTARFSSPLGVYDFQKRSSVIGVSAEGARTLGQVAATLAYGEGLQAHARSAEYRFAGGTAGEPSR
jgi:histidinol dehydrogenase